MRKKSARLQRVFNHSLFCFPYNTADASKQRKTIKPAYGQTDPGGYGRAAQ